MKEVMQTALNKWSPVLHFSLMVEFELACKEEKTYIQSN